MEELNEELEQENLVYEFNGTEVRMVHLDGDLWVTAEAIGAALEYPEARIGVMKVYKRHAEELKNHSCVTSLVTQGEDGKTQRRSVRVFNEEGVMIVTMLSRQPKAAAFRAWAVGVLKAYRRGELALNSPGERDHLLELCLREGGKGNVAALETLVRRYGYGREVVEGQLAVLAALKKVPGEQMKLPMA